MHRVARGFFEVAILAVTAAGVVAAQTIVVTPSNPQGWQGYTYYGAGGTAPGTGASAGITSTFPFPASGTGSAEIKLADNSNSEADWMLTYPTTTGHQLGSLSALSYSWFRSSRSTTDPLAVPAFALAMSDGCYLIYEPTYSSTNPVPLDTWTVADALSGTYWRSNTGSATGRCATYGAFQGLAAFNAECYGGVGEIAGIDMFMGYTAPGTFVAAVDMPTIGFAGNAPTAYDFEMDPSTVPEPSSLALLGTGLFGLIPMVRRRLR